MHSKLTAGVAAVALLCAMRGGAQQCALDLDGGGTTTVNELIVAVNQALRGCDIGTPPTPTPIDSCPFDFSTQGGLGADLCLYLGDATADLCTPSRNVVADWITDGSTVIGLVVLDSDTSIAVTGQRTSGTTATIRSWSVGPDFAAEVPTFGAMHVDTRQEFSFNFSSGSTVCGTIFYTGGFADIGHAAATAATTSAQGGPSVAEMLRLRPSIERSTDGDTRLDKAELMRQLRARLVELGHP